MDLKMPWVASSVQSHFYSKFTHAQFLGFVDSTSVLCFEFIIVMTCWLLGKCLYHLGKDHMGTLNLHVPGFFLQQVIIAKSSREKEKWHSGELDKEQFEFYAPKCHASAFISCCIEGNFDSI